MSNQSSNSAMSWLHLPTELRITILNELVKCPRIGEEEKKLNKNINYPPMLLSLENSSISLKLISLLFNQIWKNLTESCRIPIGGS
jgi:hypothetical protein